eukprot:2054564-Pyramimonas_sp.AAC.1
MDFARKLRHKLWFGIGRILLASVSTPFLAIPFWGPVLVALLNSWLRTWALLDVTLAVTGPQRCDHQLRH